MTTSRPSARRTTSRPSARGGVWVDSDDEDSQGSRRSKASSAGSKLMSLLCIVWPAGMKKFPQCFYCKHCATEASPLKEANKNDRYGGLWPWNSYRKSETPNAEGNWTKWPRGAVCSICQNVFSTIGYDVKYGTMAKYKITMAKQTGAEIHANFLRSVKLWIERHNEGAGRRLKNISQLTDVHHQLTVNQEGISGFKNRRRIFVEEEHWDEEKDGKFDASKAVELQLFGKMRRGCYKFVGREGVFECDEREQTRTNNATVELDDSGALAEECLAAKSEVLNGAMQSQIREAEEKAVTVSPAPMDWNLLLALADFNVNPASSSKATNARDDHESDNVVTTSESSEAEGEEANAASDRLRQAYASGGGSVEAKASKPAAKPKPKSSKAGAPAKTRGSSSEMPHLARNNGLWPGTSQSPSESRSSKTASGQATAQQTPTKANVDMRLDGRAQRLLTTCQSLIQRVQTLLHDTKFDEHQEGAILLGAALTQFNKSVASKGAELAKMGKEVKDIKIRVEKSANTAAFSEEIEALSNIYPMLEQLSGFVEFIIKPVTDMETAKEVTQAQILKQASM